MIHILESTQRWAFKNLLSGFSGYQTTNKNMKSSGFTLAEVLITLVIIGVIAAITIPIIYENYQKEASLTALKKVYSEVNQAINWSIAENGNMAGWDFNLGQADFFHKYLNKYIILKDENFLEGRTNNNIQYYQISGKPETGLAIFNPSLASYNSTHYLYLTSGAQIIIPNNSAPDGSEYDTRGFYVDINGFKKPNTFGKDVFSIIIFKDYGLYLQRTEGSESFEDGQSRTIEQLKNGPSTQKYQCNKNGRGIWCGALLQASGWKFPKDYPW